MNTVLYLKTMYIIVISIRIYLMYLPTVLRYIRQKL